MRAKKYVLQKYFEGTPKPGDLLLEEEELPALKDGQYLVEALYLSVDPYMRIFSKFERLKSVMIGSQVGKIIQSKSARFPVGSYVVGYFGWRTYSVVDEEVRKTAYTPPYILHDLQGLPLSLGLGVLGLPGHTAYFGMTEILRPRSGDTVLISSAAGPVGSHAGQIAKILGCRVIGIVGSDSKGKWLTEQLGFDYYINYKTHSVPQELKRAAPRGIDCYFDNVGGELLSVVINEMNTNGRIAACGANAEYNSELPLLVASNQMNIILKQLKMEGFLMMNKWNDRIPEAMQQNIRWIKEGRLKYEETCVCGFENMFHAFSNLLKGTYRGKTIIRA